MQFKKRGGGRNKEKQIIEVSLEKQKVVSRWHLEHWLEFSFESSS